MKTEIQLLEIKQFKQQASFLKERKKSGSTLRVSYPYLHGHLYCSPSCVTGSFSYSSQEDSFTLSQSNLYSFIFKNENQEFNLQFLVIEFNDLKSELNIVMASAIMKRFETKPSPPVVHDSGFNPNYHRMKTPLYRIKICLLHLSTFISRSLCQIWTILKYLNMKNRYRHELATKEKVEELERYLRQMKGIDSLGSVELVILVSTWVWNSMQNSSAFDFKDMMEKAILMPS